MNYQAIISISFTTLILFSTVSVSETDKDKPSKTSGKENQSMGANVVQLGGMPLYDPNIKSRAITAENQTGAKGQGGKEGNRRKGSPCLWSLEKGQVYTFAEIDGPGIIRHIWIAAGPLDPVKARNVILRFYWDDQKHPSVEAPITDFFGIAHGRLVTHESEYTVNPEGRSFNCYFPMPFKKKARLTVTNENDEAAGVFFYQVDYTTGDAVTEDTPYFHAQFRRVLNTKLYEDYIILDGVKGKGRFLGANIGLIDRFAKSGAWWGEGEVKMYLDGDTTHPTICGTGAEDYAGSAWGLGKNDCLDMGAPLIDGRYISFYRYHTKDPVYFSKDIKVTIQQMGNDGIGEPADINGPFGEFIRRGEYKKDNPGGFFERVDDMCSTAYWYQTLPTQPFPAFPTKELRIARLAPEGTRIEAENLKVIEKTGGPVDIHDLLIGRQLWFKPVAPGAKFTVELPVERSGKYLVSLTFTKAGDYGIFQAKLDGKQIFGPVDGYVPLVIQSSFTEPVEVELTEGTHELTFEVTGKKAESSGYMVGIDGIYLKQE